VADVLFLPKSLVPEEGVLDLSGHHTLLHKHIILDFRVVMPTHLEHHGPEHFREMYFALPTSFPEVVADVQDLNVLGHGLLGRHRGLMLRHKGLLILSLVSQTILARVAGRAAVDANGHGELK